MNVRPRWLLVAAAMLVSGAAVAAAFGTSTSDWRRLHRPLHFSARPSSLALPVKRGVGIHGRSRAQRGKARVLDECRRR
jgi:hypothetical protein